MNYIKRSDAASIEEVVAGNVGMPIEDFLKDCRFPHIKNIKEGVRMVLDFIDENPDAPLYCVGDYDSDGVCASDIIDWGFRKLGKPIKIRIPHRMSEGYGLSEKIIEEFGEGPGLILTVDNGIAAYNAIKKAKDRGFTVIITDHHLAPKDKDGNMVLPPADLIIDPHIEDESEFQPLCGAALAYYFVKEMFPGAKLYPLLALASIATVTDVMPLVGVNRTIVKDGLQIVNAGNVVPGLKALMDIKQTEVVTEDDYGFLFGPIFNAAGRLYDNGGDMVLKVLGSTRNNPELPWLAQDLIKTNEKRKEIVKDSMVIAEALVTDERPIVIYHPGFQEGIVGIIAGHLCEKYNTPAAVFTKTETGIYKGSARSTENIHLKNALDKISGEMLGYGGHAGAAGIAVQPENFQSFKAAFIKSVGSEQPASIQDYIMYDLDIMQHQVFDAAEELKRFAPYGEGNPKICFHSKLDLKGGSYFAMGDGSHFAINFGSYKVLGFGMAEKYKDLGSPEKIDALFNISEDWYKGNKTIRLELVDFM